MDIIRKVASLEAEMKDLASLAGKNSIKQLAKIKAEIEAAQQKKFELEQELEEYTNKLNSILQNYSDLNITKEYIEQKLSEGLSVARATVRRIPKSEKVSALISILKKNRITTFAELSTAYSSLMNTNLGSSDALISQGLLTDRCLGKVEGTNFRAGRPLFQNELLKHLETMQ
jgi:chromosome segregation ATPase